MLIETEQVGCCLSGRAGGARLTIRQGAEGGERELFVRGRSSGHSSCSGDVELAGNCRRGEGPAAFGSERGLVI